MQQNRYWVLYQNNLFISDFRPVWLSVAFLRAYDLSISRTFTSPILELWSSTQLFVRQCRDVGLCARRWLFRALSMWRVRIFASSYRRFRMILLSIFYWRSIWPFWRVWAEGSFLSRSPSLLPNAWRSASEEHRWVPLKPCFSVGSN